MTTIATKKEQLFYFISTAPDNFTLGFERISKLVKSPLNSQWVKAVLKHKRVPMTPNAPHKPCGTDDSQMK